MHFRATVVINCALHVQMGRIILGAFIIIANPVLVNFILPVTFQIIRCQLRILSHLAEIVGPDPILATNPTCS